jgi:hypothetical protein
MATRKKNKITSINDDEMAILCGTLLGDSTLGDRKNGTYRLKVEHCEAQSEYTYWLHNKLQRLCSNTKGPTVTKARKTANSGIVFYSNTSPIFKDLYELFYKKKENGKYVKTITQELIDKLPMSPYVLATLWMDDGSVRNDAYSGKIATMGFPKQENELLIKYLEKWGLNCKVVLNSEEKQHYYISVPAASFPKLVSIMEPVISQIPTMTYKLNSDRKPCND